MWKNQLARIPFFGVSKTIQFSSFVFASSVAGKLVSLNCSCANVHGRACRLAWVLAQMPNISQKTRKRDTVRAVEIFCPVANLNGNGCAMGLGNQVGCGVRIADSLPHLAPTVGWRDGALPARHQGGLGDGLQWLGGDRWRLCEVEAGDLLQLGGECSVWWESKLSWSRRNFQIEFKYLPPLLQMVVFYPRTVGGLLAIVRLSLQKQASVIVIFIAGLVL